MTYKKNWVRIKWWEDDDGGSPITKFEVRVKNVDGGYSEPEACADLTYLDDHCFVDIQDMHKSISSGGFGIAWGGLIKF